MDPILCKIYDARAHHKFYSTLWVGWVWVSVFCFWLQGTLMIEDSVKAVLHLCSTGIEFADGQSQRGYDQERRCH